MIASRDPVTLEHAKIAAYVTKDLDFNRALQVNDIVSHRQKAGLGGSYCVKKPWSRSGRKNV
jgi:hypothetical protein